VTKNILSLKQLFSLVINAINDVLEKCTVEEKDTFAAVPSTTKVDFCGDADPGSGRKKNGGMRATSTSREARQGSPNQVYMSPGEKLPWKNST
jgi:hypothetical protein